MKRFWQIITLVLLALIVPASMCCWGADGCVSQELSSCSAEDHHEHEHDKDEHHAPTSCPGETLAHSQISAPVTMPVMQMVELMVLISEMIRPQDELSAALGSFGLPMTTAPPEMRTTWHFTSRAALPARAPSSGA